MERTCWIRHCQSSKENVRTLVTETCRYNVKSVNCFFLQYLLPHVIWISLWRWATNGLKLPYILILERFYFIINNFCYSMQMTWYKATNPVKTKKHTWRRNCNFINFTGDRTSQKNRSPKNCGRNATIRFVFTSYIRITLHTNSL